ncbi:hypothetical protein ABB37_01215 [Leptomonas pyrrhocoris]|uniref:Uncharacterized protein n=1 Tax=Leptomonas pyrrhocoris TaxID=157538 RepID=A0A0M9G8B8_LEPPY|nr:hypothetical protein ABB37_01215 [Leptomonas pyrrhocoris]KPA84713.1 hypothetical protein ABB37_01215 [Leptomonas pyrrhocoris]|eukprot:XP_015663152.1 hypothetical protein ABB37_01215 [Leptomonas pyrrhocoris]
MSLLLDDDEVFTPPAKCVKPDVHTIDCDDDGNTSPGRPSASATAPVAVKSGVGHTTTSPSATTRAVSTPSRSATEAAAVTIARKGGDGMAKMEALLFGMPKAAVVGGRAATTSQASRTAVASDEGITAADGTPAAQRTRLPASPFNSDMRSNVSSSTHPKVVSGANSPTSLSSPSQRPVSVASSEDSLLAAQKRVDETHVAVASPAASPSPHPPVQRALASSADNTPTQPAKTQMKLSDFFSKMACKR